ncbi:MAG: type II secretion system major pseudopilin GspG [Planctomycetales bacterium]|nr:type II secretion system major pseudopilin GspG [Planctomycetales bacterium]
MIRSHAVGRAPESRPSALRAESRHGARPRTVRRAGLRLGPAALVRGFTLVELLLVIIIIGTLAAIVVPKFTGRSEDARIAAAKMDIKVLEGAFERYGLDNLDKYPTTDQGLQALLVVPTTAPMPKSWRGPYIKGELPRDPWGNPYKYVSPGTHDPDFDIWSSGADGQDGTADDITSWATGASGGK